MTQYVVMLHYTASHSTTCHKNFWCLADPEEQDKVRKAMDAIESKTCVKFVTREKQSGYITINREKVGK